ncbi:MAG: hypothetical protein ACI9NY_002006, partial [Kiritimatiellia bacterium]
NHWIKHFLLLNEVGEKNITPYTAGNWSEA